MRIGDIVRHEQLDTIPEYKRALFDRFTRHPLPLEITEIVTYTTNGYLIRFKETGDSEWVPSDFKIIDYINPGDALEGMFKGNASFGNSMLAYQLATSVWVDAAFKDCKNADGEDVITSLNERNYRGFEENCELYQSGGMTREQMHKIVDMVQDKPVEQVIEKEVGGVLSTLAAFCNARNIDMWKCAVEGLKRNWEQIDAIRDRQKNKPAMKGESKLTSTEAIVKAIQNGEATCTTMNFRWNKHGVLEQYFKYVIPHQRIDQASGIWKPVPREE
jgi:hypothetical protein